MSDVILSSAAEEEFTEALCWYSERSRSAAERFDAEFDRALKTIAENPERFPICDDRHRFYLMRRFPYQLIYRSDQESVVIVAVAHTSRRPRYWSDR